jgi:hypothetical protein
LVGHITTLRGSHPVDRFPAVEPEAVVIERSGPVAPGHADVDAWLGDQHVLISTIIEGMRAERQAVANAVESARGHAVWLERFGGHDNDAEGAYLAEDRSRRFGTSFADAGGEGV